MQQLLKLEPGELRPPTAAGLLVQPVDEDETLTFLKDEVTTLFRRE